MKNPKKKFADRGVDAAGNPGAQCAAFLDGEFARWNGGVDAGGIEHRG